MIRYSDFDDLSENERITMSGSGSAASGLHSFHNEKPIRIDDGSRETKRTNLSHNESVTSSSSSEEEEPPKK